MIFKSREQRTKSDVAGTSVIFVVLRGFIDWIKGDPIISGLILNTSYKYKYMYMYLKTVDIPWKSKTIKVHSPGIVNLSTLTKTIVFTQKTFKESKLGEVTNQPIPTMYRRFQRPLVGSHFKGWALRATWESNETHENLLFELHGWKDLVHKRQHLFEGCIQVFLANGKWVLNGWICKENWSWQHGILWSDKRPSQNDMETSNYLGDFVCSENK